MRKCLVFVLLPVAMLASSVAIPVIKWKPDDRSQHKPPVLTPGTESSQTSAGKPPSDAIVLFDGHDLSGWLGKKGAAAPWKVGDGYFQVVPGSGDIHTTRSFGDCQLHVEWASPNPPHGTDQDRGNSGVYLMSNYEIQVLDSYQAPTYADGQAGAVYTQYPPLVNATLPPGQWQTYDIVFHGPRFTDAGELTRAATVTVFHNGVLIQDHVTLTGPTAWEARPPYKKHATELPLLLQDHHHPVRFRNIWIRPLKDQ